MQGICEDKDMSSRGYGEVYKAFDKGSGVYVAVKKTRLLLDDAVIRRESEMLTRCFSPFIVRYNGVIRNGNELWVLFGRRGDRIDCYGILPLWITCSMHSQWKSLH